jgi:hypothetical protein
MTKNEQIIELFKREFAEFHQFTKNRNSCSFKCSCMDSCKVDLVKEAAYTPAIGNENTEVMLVAESPSTKLGKGAFIAGHVDAIDPGDKTINKLIGTIKKYYGGITPYFTDVIKCGLERTALKEKLAARKKNCVEKFLIQEIKIMHPKKIVCVGKFSFDIVKTIQVQGKIDSKIEVVQITHYSQRGSLPLTIDDKAEIMWPIELGLISKEEALKGALELKHIKARINKLASSKK